MIKDDESEVIEYSSKDAQAVEEIDMISKAYKLVEAIKVAEQPSDKPANVLIPKQKNKASCTL